MIKKHWTVRNGQVGTAHTSRDGREVDFRAATEPPQVDGSDERKFIVIQPPRGVRGVEELRLELGPDSCERVVIDKDLFHKGQQVIKLVFRARFCGVELVAEQHRGLEWYDKEAEAAEQAREAARRREGDAEWQAQKQFLKDFPREKFCEKATRRNVGRLAAGRHIIKNVLINILRAEAEEAGFVNPYFVNRHVWDTDEDELEEISGKILEHAEAQRLEQKRKWLEQSGQGGEVCQLWKV